MKSFSLVLAALTGSAVVQAADLVLVDKGVAPAPIIVSEAASPRTRETAQVLADYVGKICGTKPELLTHVPEPFPERAIWIGLHSAVNKALPSVDFEFKHPEEILIAATEKHVVIAGRDRWSPQHAEVKTKEGLINDVQQEYGTVNAIYTFLQEQLGVRWLWPGELGEDAQQRERIAFAPFEHRHHPQIRSRGGVFHFSSLGDEGYGRAHEWTLRQRLQLDSLTMEGGHGFGDWWARYHEKYPEIFALQPDGTRSGFPNPHNAKLCMSNPKVWELWLMEIEDELAHDPNRTLFNASPNDSWASGHCVCPNCSAWDHPEGEPRQFHWFKRKELRPATSDRDVTFANKLGQLLERKYPGKGYRVLMNSYGHSRPVPVKARPAANVIMSCVANFFGRTGLVDRGSTRGDTFRDQFEAWAKFVPSMLWRPNTGSPAGWQQGLPDLSTQQTIRDFKDVAGAHCEGIFIDSVWEHWATQGPQYYVMAQLTWDPAVDAEVVLADYYQRGFGAAASSVREYYEGVESARAKFTAGADEPGVFAFPKLYTDELLRESFARLERAAAAVAPGSIHARRIAFVKAGLHYTKLTVENIKLMDGYWKKKDSAVAAQVRQNWEKIEKLVAAHPYAVNWGPVRPGTKRMVGLHPDHPPAKEKKKPANDLDLN